VDARALPRSGTRTRVAMKPASIGRASGAQCVLRGHSAEQSRAISRNSSRRPVCRELRAGIAAARTCDVPRAHNYGSADEDRGPAKSSITRLRALEITASTTQARAESSDNSMGPRSPSAGMDFFGNCCVSERLEH